MTPRSIAVLLLLSAIVACASSDDAELVAEGRSAVVQRQVGNAPKRRSIASGYGHTCVVRANGTVYCWGYNAQGQLGNGTTASSAVAVQVTGVTTAVMVAAGEFHSCAVLADGSVKCWGYNGNGELGDNTVTNSAVPVSVGSLGGVRAIGAGAYHTCAVKSDGSTVCWGRNDHGQIGDGSTTDRHLPTAIGLTNALDVRAGYFHTCANLADGTAKCWGMNDHGQIGDGTVVDRWTPTTVTSLSYVTAITAAGYHSCALDNATSVRCWGSNASGEGGNGTYADEHYATTVLLGGGGALMGVETISAGLATTCATMADGGTRCWGSNNHGQLGLNNPGSGPVPIGCAAGYSTCSFPQLAGDTTITYGASRLGALTEIAVGDYHACGLRTNGTVACWGYDGDGELGLGATGSDVIAPTKPVALAAGPTPPLLTGAGARPAIDGGAYHFCSLQADGSARCWGDNAGASSWGGQLGDGTATSRSTPVEVVGLSGASAISAGAFHTCAVSRGLVFCWGTNDHGQLGDGTTTARSLPTLVPNLRGVVAIAAGAYHTCALGGSATYSGYLYCWGDNTYGQLGTGDTSRRLSPTVIMSGATGITAGDWHSCAAYTNGTVGCWGSNAFGQLGIGSTTDKLTPTSITGLGSVVTVAAGNLDTCAMLADGTMECWGYNGAGQLGDGTTTQRTAPVFVRSAPNTNLTGVAAIAPSAVHTCALRDTGIVQCWGSNAQGQIGDGTYVDRLFPVTASTVTNASAIAVAGYDTCAVLADGTAKCWGYNGVGESGNGTTTMNPSPVVVSTLARDRAVSNACAPGAVGCCVADFGACATSSDCCGNSCIGNLCVSADECPAGGTWTPPAHYAWANAPQHPLNDTSSGVHLHATFISDPSWHPAASSPPYDAAWADGLFLMRSNTANQCSTVYPECTLESPGVYGTASNAEIGAYVPFTRDPKNYGAGSRACSVDADCPHPFPNPEGDGLRCVLGHCGINEANHDLTWYTTPSNGHASWVMYQCVNGVEPNPADMTTWHPVGGGTCNATTCTAPATYIVTVDIANPDVINWQAGTVGAFAALDVPGGGYTARAYDVLNTDNLFVENTEGACGHFVYSGSTPVAFVRQYHPEDADDPAYEAAVLEWASSLRSKLITLSGPPTNGAAIGLGPNLGLVASPGNEGIEQILGSTDAVVEELIGSYATDADWLQHIRYVEEVQRHGTAHEGIIQFPLDAPAPGAATFCNPAISSSNVLWGLATYLMANERSATAYISALWMQGLETQQYGCALNYPEYQAAAAIGHPCGCIARTSSTSSVFTRKFSKGFVAIVPAAADSSGSFALPAGLFDEIDGATGLSGTQMLAANSGHVYVLESGSLCN